MLLFSITATAQEKWITKQIDGKLSVSFPSEPKKETKNGIDTYVVKEKDSVAYSVGTMDLKLVLKLDSAALAPLKDDPRFAKQLMEGMASTKLNYKFGEVTIGKWNTLTTYNVSAVDDTAKNVLSIQMIFLGSRLYVLTCRVPAALTTKKNELFFNSLTLIK